ncbi:MAG: hypothetical protein HDT29_04820 [Clostridiales bacterium]|nr:hypothetical protein [Clostridiales bacterium]
MKKKIKGKANPRFGDSVFVKADKAVAELEARGFTIVEVRGAEGTDWSDSILTKIMNVIREMWNQPVYHDIVITIIYK